MTDKKVKHIDLYSDPKMAALNADWIKHVAAQRRRDEVLKMAADAKHIDLYGDPETAELNADWIKHAFPDSTAEDLAAYDVPPNPPNAVNALKSMLAVAKGSSSSGNFGHAGRPGKVGGSAPRGGGKSPSIPDWVDGGLSAFDKTEGAIVMERKNPQMAVPKPGITRDQIAAYYRRRNAVKDAWLYRYNDGTTAAENVNARLADGYTKVKTDRAGHIVLTNPRTGSTQRYKRGVEIDYVNTLFNRKNMKRNYDV